MKSIDSITLPEEVTSFDSAFSENEFKDAKIPLPFDNDKFGTLKIIPEKYLNDK